MSKRHIVNIGDRFGILVVFKENSVQDPSGKKRRVFDVVCDCGTITTRSIRSLTEGSSTNCGCLPHPLKSKDTNIAGSTAKGNPVLSVEPFSQELDLIGLKYGRWTIIGVGFRAGHSRMVKVHCQCGTVRVVRKTQILKKKSSSCGCENTENFVKRIKLPEGTIRGGTYSSWCSMIHRSCNENNQGYEDYMGRGIDCCDSWKICFENFLADMGERPEGMSLDRIDNNKGYSKENCRWATANEQNWNRRRPKTATSGRVGVSFNKVAQKWSAYIGHMGNNYKLGYFNSYEEAVLAREEAEIKYYGALKEI